MLVVPRMLLRPAVTDGERMEDYLDGRRRAFLCAKSADLSAVDSDPEEPPPFARVTSRLRQVVRHGNRLTRKRAPEPV